MIAEPEDRARSGAELLHDPHLNKGTAFTEKERDAFGLRGLLPPHISTIEEQEDRVLSRMRKEATDLQKHMYLVDLQERNQTLFYHIVMKHLDEIMPLIYTPTVGKACQEYGHIFRNAQGVYISLDDKGRILEVLENWPEDNVEVIVVTDGERILGLGDLGASGMGIPVGKLSLYTACAGIDPKRTLPITLDMGTNNQEFQKDPLYLGLRHPRVTGDEFDEFMEEFVNAVKERFPKALLQFEDFGNSNAFRLLETYRTQLPSFNDDIQGTAGVTLAGVYASLRITGSPLTEQKIVFLGAGEAGIGIGELFVSAMIEDGLTEEEARSRCWFVDSRGLVVKSRTDLRPHKLAFAHDAEFQPDLLSAIKELQPTIIIGASGQPRMFTQDVIEEMSRINERPIIFSLSNPTSKSECTAEEAYTWSDGKAIFASGSPFDPVEYKGQHFVPGQGNNSYVFPGIGLGAVVSQTTQVTDEMFLAAARTLANLTDGEDLAVGRVYPPLSDIRDISAHIAKAVVEIAVRDGLARADLPEDPMPVIREKMYQPVYREYV